MTLASSGQRRTLVMGILNVTTDSFSDGGCWLDSGAAIERGAALLAAGADLVDVGGESTRPGAVRVSEGEELARVVPVVEALSGLTRGSGSAGKMISIDTTRAGVARAALAAGADAINDVSGALADSAMPSLMAASGAMCIVGHWRGDPATMTERTDYAPRGVVAEVRDHLRARVDALIEAGVARSRLVVDPGLGFAKDAEHDWALLRALPEFVADGIPVLVGASRKRFLGTLLAGRPPVGSAPVGRDDATAAVSALAAAAGAWGVRVHEVAASADAVRVGAAWGRP